MKYLSLAFSLALVAVSIQPSVAANRYILRYKVSGVPVARYFETLPACSARRLVLAHDRTVSNIGTCQQF